MYCIQEFSRAFDKNNLNDTLVSLNGLNGRLQRASASFTMVPDTSNKNGKYPDHIYIFGNKEN
jgi:hypothetical protein